MSGYVPIWSEDVERYFSQCGDEYILFSYLLLSSHYSDNPYPKWIEGRTQKKEKYKKEWVIVRGDVLTSKTKIKEMWKFSKTFQRKLLTNLVEKKLIEILLEDPALIIRILNYDRMVWAGKVSERPAEISHIKEESPKEESPQKEGRGHSNNGGGNSNDGGGHSKVAAVIGGDEKKSKNEISNDPNYNSDPDPKFKTGGERERARAEDPPSNKISSIGNGIGIGGNGTGITQEGENNTSPEVGHEVSELEKRLVERWSGRSKEIAKIEVSRDKIHSEVKKMLKLYTVEQNHEILDYLKTATTAAALTFISPDRHNKNFYEHPLLIVKIFQDMQKEKKGSSLGIKEKGEKAEANKQDKMKKHQEKYLKLYPVPKTN